MARKTTLNRMQLRDEHDAAEVASKGKEVTKEDGEKEKKPAPKRKSRAKTAAVVRVKLYWGVFSQSLKRVAMYEYSQRKQADKKCEELNKASKTQHFVQKVKETIQE